MWSDIIILWFKRKTTSVETIALNIKRPLLCVRHFVTADCMQHWVNHFWVGPLKSIYFFNGGSRCSFVFVFFFLHRFAWNPSSQATRHCSTGCIRGPPTLPTTITWITYCCYLSILTNGTSFDLTQLRLIKHNADVIRLSGFAFSHRRVDGRVSPSLCETATLKVRAGKGMILRSESVLCHIIPMRKKKSV